MKVLAFPAQPGNRASLFLAEGAKLVHSDNIKPPSNGALVPVKIPRGGPAYFGVKLPAAAAARSLFLQFEGSVSAHCEVQARENGEFRTIRAFDISRVNFNPNVGFNPRAPVVISFPEVKSDEFRLVFTRVGGDATLARLSLTPTPIVERFPEKTLAKMIQHPTLSWGDYLWESQTGDTAAALKPDDVRDISRHLAADGTLSWQVPAGEWVILRTGMTPTGTRNSPSSPQGIGLEVDKMSRTHTTSHFDAFLGEIIRRVPAAERKSFKVAVLDSYETGGQNFTDGFLEQFRGRYGYDPLPFLPAYHGHTVGSPDLSDRFLWDVRRLVADKVAYDYVGGLRDASNKHGVTTWLENYGHWGFPAEFLQYGGQSDEVGGEFWSEGNLGSIENRCASSCAHIYGKKRVWAESFTSGGDEFRRHPARLKRRGDWAFTEGVNSSLLHVYIQQYDNDDYPGVTAWFGAEFNRKNSWFPHIDLFTLYLRRCNFMLQQGRHSADVAYFIGEDTPKMTGIREPALPKGYNYDYINAEVILRDLAVKDGRLVLPHGMTYRVLVLPPQDTMRPELLRKIEQLVADGATVLGAPPSRSPSLQNYPAADAEVRALAAKLWSAAPARHRLYGKGQIFTGVRLEDVFEHLGLSPEFAVEPAAPVLHTRRIAADADIFFITNQSERRVQITPHFRVTGKQPEHWNPVTGERRKLPAYTQDARATAVPLQLEPSESAFVVFREKVGKPVAGTGAAGLAANFPQGEVLAKAAAPWEVRFESDPVKRGPAEPVVFAALQDWSKHPDSRIRHFSGVARYTTTLHLGELPKDKKLRLDLGKVALLAKVKINGKNAGGAWTPPYSLEIT
ncbi:MAG: hypothetical protein LBC18_04755, partial [Opitutaceae bacterium]|nr:hypothetical protein [Opitutaceae bacterium]